MPCKLGMRTRNVSNVTTMLTLLCLRLSLHGSILHLTSSRDSSDCYGHRIAPSRSTSLRTSDSTSSALSCQEHANAIDQRSCLHIETVAQYLAVVACIYDNMQSQRDAAVLQPDTLCVQCWHTRHTYLMTDRMLRDPAHRHADECLLIHQRPVVRVHT